MSKSPHRFGQHTTGTLPFPRACVYTLLTGLIGAAVLLLIGTAIAYAQADPASFALPAALTALYLALILSGITASRTSDAPVAAGAICGVFWLLLFLLISLIGDNGAEHALGTLPAVLAYAGIPAASMLGVLIGKKRAKRPTSKHKKHRR